MLPLRRSTRELAPKIRIPKGNHNVTLKGVKPLLFLFSGDLVMTKVALHFTIRYFTACVCVRVCRFTVRESEIVTVLVNKNTE